MTILRSVLKLAAAGFVATAPFSDTALAEFAAVGNPKPAVILFGASNDGGWSQAIDEARRSGRMGRRPHGPPRVVDLEEVGALGP